MIATKEMRNAWFKFKESYKSSGRDGTPSITSFAAGWNLAMKSINHPVGNVYDFDLPTTRTGYIVVNYNLCKEDNPAPVIFLDGHNKECIVADDSFSTYVYDIRPTSNIGFYSTRKEARKEAYMNNDEDPDFKEAVWKVELDDKNNIVKWIKKNP